MIQQDDIAGTYARSRGSQSGLGDTLFSGWFSPVAPTSSGWIWGVGPALVFAIDEAISRHGCRISIALCQRILAELDRI